MSETWLLLSFYNYYLKYYVESWFGDAGSFLNKLEAWLWWSTRVRSLWEGHWYWEFVAVTCKNQLLLSYCTSINLFITLVVSFHLLFVQKERQQSNQLVCGTLDEHESPRDTQNFQDFLLNVRDKYVPLSWFLNMIAVVYISILSRANTTIKVFAYYEP